METLSKIIALLAVTYGAYALLDNIARKDATSHRRHHKSRFVRKITRPLDYILVVLVTPAFVLWEISKGLENILDVL